MKENVSEKLFGYYFSPEIEAQLINLLRVRNKEKVNNLVDYIFETNYNKYYTPCNMLTLFKYDFLSMAIKVYSPENEKHRFFIEKLLSIQKITSSETMEDFRNAANEVVDFILDNYENQTKNHLIIEIVNYVDENYSTPNLCVSMIAAHFNVHISYLSTIFKKHMFIGLAEYIQCVRITKAKNMLECTNNKIEKIANDVGYFSLHTFVRVFKNSVGITPARYRQIQKSNM